MLEHEKKRQKFEIFGWVLFVICAFFYIATSYNAGDMIGFIGGLFFLAACVVFLAAYFIKPDPK